MAGKYFSDIKIHLLTPLRIKKGNALEYQKIKIDHLLRSIFQRKKSLFDNEEVYSLDYAPHYAASVKALEYKPLYRKSERQGRKILMDGVIGEMAAIGLDKQSYELLRLGEIIGVGKQTVFGMGKIALMPLKS
jgi:CRISPR/Cas system endoribonuclease Cas6 (RAMP superfamily)